MRELDLQFVDETVARLGRRPEAIIAILQAIQGHYRYLPPAALRRVVELTEITAATIAGVSTFYNQFRHQPVGRHMVRVCHGTACHVKGAQVVHEAFQRRLGIAAGSDTDAAGLFTVEKVVCLGCCTLAPVVQIDGVTYGGMTSHRVAAVLEDFLARQAERPPAAGPAATSAGPPLGEIRIGLGSCCVAQGSGQVHEAIQRAIAASGAPVVLKTVGCVGMCHQMPLVELVPAAGPARLFSRVRAQSAADIVHSQFKPKGLARRLGYALSGWLDRLQSDEAGDTVGRHALNAGDRQVCAFLGRQVRVATEYCGQLTPTDLDQYLDRQGFEALRHCLQRLSPAEIVEQITAAGLRGRGGAGFPTGVKWAAVRNAPGEKKYVLCNGDEGDPGAFMDRMLLESFPYRIIEGMAIAARAVGADEGVFYIRAEYSLAVRRISEALEQCRRRGLLGRDILGSDFCLDIEVRQGAGAFVCGEETALLAALEGRRGTPRLRPPYPAQRGLWGKPTAVNNVETYALVPWIFRHGGARFAELGTAGSKGTKVFALAGKIRRGGLIEVPMGVTIRQIVEEIGGGVGGKRWKAVQIGGPSGGCLPAELADTPVDYEALAQLGAIMGSGGLIVLDEDDCMVDIARFFLAFTQQQSCGKCTFCRVGTRRMLDILDRICGGGGKAGDLEALESLGRSVAAGSVCGLGRTAPNPVLSTLRHFRGEYEAHLAGRCPAGKCKALVAYRIDDRCIGCTLCAQQCPADAIAMTPYVRHVIDLEKCIRCDTCRQVCPVDAVVVE
jgi:NADH:ubiquinone oxidoreductase subunit F (NADH-binding)/NADH:ubiquinone oxidoreductase subunit E/NAD-dependent dihydropyrimidine dehydrogenase PreA subunit